MRSRNVRLYSSHARRPYCPSSNLADRRLENGNPIGNLLGVMGSDLALTQEWSAPSPSPSGNLPPGRTKCPTTPLLSMLCFFLEFPVSVFHHPVHELLSRPSSSSLPFHSSFYHLPLYTESCLLDCVQSSSNYIHYIFILPPFPILFHSICVMSSGCSPSFSISTSQKPLSVRRPLFSSSKSPLRTTHPLFWLWSFAPSIDFLLIFYLSNLHPSFSRYLSASSNPLYQTPSRSP